jgi:diaminopimelate decarboxylase
MARACGWWAEGISADEVRWSVEQGFDSSNVILNGPLTHQHAADTPVAIAFADTVEAFREILRSDRIAIPGIRVCPPSVTSRFGVALNGESLDAIALAVRERNRLYAVHFHRAIPVIGPDAWWRAAGEVIDWTSRIAERAGIAPVAIDFGGGWHADDFIDVLLPGLGDLHARVARALPSIERMFFEPGKAIAAPSSCLVATIADVRMADGHVRDIVVDTSIAQLPTTRWMPHRALHLGRDGSRTWLGSGSSRVLGNVCMEVDVVLENVGFTRVPQAGDRLLIADAGAYDASMAWPFARGKMI